MKRRARQRTQQNVVKKLQLQFWSEWTLIWMKLCIQILNLKVKVFDTDKSQRSGEYCYMVQKKRNFKRTMMTHESKPSNMSLEFFLNTILCEIHCHSINAKSTSQCTWSEIFLYDTIFHIKWLPTVEYPSKQRYKYSNHRVLLEFEIPTHQIGIFYSVVIWCY